MHITKGDWKVLLKCYNVPTSIDLMVIVSCTLIGQLSIAESPELIAAS